MQNRLHDFVNPGRSFIHCYIIPAVLSQPPIVCPNPTVFLSSNSLSEHAERRVHLSKDEMSPTAHASDNKRKVRSHFAQYQMFSVQVGQIHAVIYTLPNPYELVKFENNPERMAGPRTTLIYGKDIGQYR